MSSAAPVASAVDKSPERVRRMFAQIARRYDFMNAFLSMGTDRWWRRIAIKAVKPIETGPVLDVCTGTGDLALALWKAGRKRVDVVGTDFTPEMLELANRKRDARRIPGGSRGVVFREADTMQLPFPNDQFEAVTVAFGIRNVTDTLEGIREMVRVCRPGGKVLVLDFSMPAGKVIGPLYRWYFRRILPRLGQLLAKNREAAYDYLPQSVGEFAQGEEFLDLYRAAGLNDVSAKPLTFGIASLYLGTKPA